MSDVNYIHHMHRFMPYPLVAVALPIILLWGVKRGDEPAEPLKPMAAR